MYICLLVQFALQLRQITITNGSKTDQQACQAKNCKIVTAEWLVASSEAKKVLPEKAYILSNSNGGDKKAKIPMLDGTTENPKKRAIKQEDENQAESNKKPKDSQRTSFKSSLNVPIDDAFFHNSPFQNKNSNYASSKAPFNTDFFFSSNGFDRRFWIDMGRDIESDGFSTEQQQILPCAVDRIARPNGVRYVDSLGSRW